MRIGRGARTRGSGGAWHCAATMKAGASSLGASTVSAASASTTWLEICSRSTEGCTKGEWNIDILLQQSRP